jgi:hypothetical protein
VSQRPTGARSGDLGWHVDHGDYDRSDRFSSLCIFLISILLFTSYYFVYWEIFCSPGVGLFTGNILFLGELY